MKPLEVYLGGDGFAFQAFWRSGKEAEVLESLEQFAKAVRKQADREDSRRFKACANKVD